MPVAVSSGLTTGVPFSTERKVFLTSYHVQAGSHLRVQ